MNAPATKVAIVTGGARDIGRAVSIKLAAAGFKVCFNYLSSAEQANETLALIKAAGGDAIAVQGDMTQSADVQKLIATAVATYGAQIDYVVNVAGGILGRKPLADLDEAFWDAVIDVNLKSVYLVCRAVLPHLVAGSAIVNFSSQAARDGGGGGALAYAASKGAVLTLTRGLAKELGPKGIRVNAVSPGMINTGFHDTFTKPEIRVNVAAATPLKREGQASEVADLVAYLLSDGASFINGESVEINGGSFFA
ncbi:MAG: oxidoreductase [Chitinophagaceae bacterium BSSC1]|nr:MAG: oxidoreductase [Chitinophagaceae bacterium BSSC1]